MPGDRISSYAPWHIILMIDDSEAVTNGAEHINAGLRNMIEEMQIRTKIGRPTYKVSVIAMGKCASIVAEAKGDRELDAAVIAAFSGKCGATKYSSGFQLAIDLLERNPGSTGDFRPYVFFLANAKADDESSALAFADRMKFLNLPAGRPWVWAFVWDNANVEFARQVSSDKEFCQKVSGFAALERLLPALSMGEMYIGEKALNRAIVNLAASS